MTINPISNNTWSIVPAQDTIDGNPIAKVPVNTTEGSSGSSAWGYLEGLAAGVKSQPASSGLVQCNISDNQIDWDAGINMNNPDGSADGEVTLPTYDSGVPMLPLEAFGTIDATVFTGPMFVEGQWIHFVAVAGGENLQNTPLEVCFGTDSREIPIMPDGAPGYQGLINTTPADPANFMLCYQTDEQGFPLMDGEGNLLPVEGYEGFGYCPTWTDFQIPGVYVARINQQCYRPNSSVPMYDETSIHTTEDSVLNSEVEGTMPLRAISSQDASGNEVSEFTCVELPFDAENPENSCNNPDGTINVHFRLKPLLDIRTLTSSPTQYQFQTGLNVWIRNRVAQGE
jgi:hypothetical protein